MKGLWVPGKKSVTQRQDQRFASIDGVLGRWRSFLPATGSVLNSMKHWTELTFGGFWHFSLSVRSTIFKWIIRWWVYLISRPFDGDFFSYWRRRSGDGSIADGNRRGPGTRPGTGLQSVNKCVESIGKNTGFSLYLQFVWQKIRKHWKQKKIFC